MKKSNTSYLYAGAVAAQQIFAKTLLIIGGFFGTLSLIGMVGGIVDRESSLTEYLSIYIFLVVFNGLLFYLGLRKNRLIEAAKRYNLIFAGDTDGIVTLTEMELQMGKSGPEVLKELQKLFQKGFFQGCTLEFGSSPCVRIRNAMKGETERGFADVKCEACGGITRLRAGSRGKCSYCGSPIADRQV